MQTIIDTLSDAFGQRQISTIYGQANQYRVIREAKPEYQNDPTSYHGIAVYKPADDGIEPCGLTSTMPRGFFRWRLKHSGFRRKLVGSRHSTLCRTVPGSSAVPFSPQRRRVPSPNANARTQGTPRDRIPISKACSLQ
jgi:hypothetical protein